MRGNGKAAADPAGVMAFQDQEIEELRDKTVSQLAYGQQKRVELGRALACEPRLPGRSAADPRQQHRLPHPSTWQRPVAAHAPGREG